MEQNIERAIRLYDDFVRQYGGSKINVTLDMFDTACLPTDPLLWIFAIGENIPQAIYSLVEPTCEDIAWDRVTKGWNPRGRLPFRFRGCRRGSRFRGNGQMDRMNQPTRGPGWYAWRFGELAQKLGWYLLVAHTVQDLAINSIGSLMQYGGCADPPDKMATGVEQGGLVYGPSTQNLHVLYAQSYSSYGPAIGPGGFIISSVTEPTIAFFVDTAEFFGQYEPPGAVWLEVERNDGATFRTEGYRQPTENGDQFTGVFYQKTAQSFSYTGRVRLRGGGGTHGGQTTQAGVLQLMGNRHRSMIDAMKKGDPCGVGGLK